MSTGRFYTVEGIVLKRKNSGEADRIITLFTKEKGKLVVTAKGIRRITSKRAPHLEVFSRGRLLLHRGHYRDTISEIEPLATYADLRNHLGRVSVAYYLCEVIDVLLPEQQEHRDVYSQLTQALVILDRGNPADDYIQVFTEKLLILLGFLSAQRRLSTEEVLAYVEQLTERKLRTRRLLLQLA
jgi:DNA repair protein RecO (recombination protein O)